MPELPEVETTRRGITPYILNNKIVKVVVRDRRLRWPVPARLKKQLEQQTIHTLDRRAKYLLFHTEHGCMILHLGMSGSLRVVPANTKPEKHDHIDIVFKSGQCLRFRDPRRFGSIHWTRRDPLRHKLLKNLGPEPLANGLNGEHLYARSRKRIQPVKTFIMDSRTVAGIGNIYANEALFFAGIHPKCKACRISRQRYNDLSDAIKDILQRALDKGGTTLRDFMNGEGNPGYFRQELQVYGRAGETCRQCGEAIMEIRLGQRSTFYCPRCQR
jgi:formamidopyrimidine-DNA glycosylase